MDDSASKETEEPQMTTIDMLNKLLRTGNEKELEQIYVWMLLNEYVIKSGLKPTFQQFREFFVLLKKGLEYNRDTYGIGAVPMNFVLYSGLMLADPRNADWIAYFPEDDRLGISMLHIAGHAAHYDNERAVFTDSHLPKGFGVRGRDYTVLQAIEEGYHGYQFKVLGLKPESTNLDRDHPLEAEIVPIFEKAIKDLSISLIEPSGEPLLK